MRRFVKCAAFGAALNAGLLMGGCANTAALKSAADVTLPPKFMLADDASAIRDIAALLPSDAGYAALRAAAADAPDLAAALARIEAARGGVRAANAELLPNSSITLNASRERASGAVQPGNPFFVRDRTVLNGGVSASWELDVFGRLRADQRAARARLNAATADAEAVRLILDTDIAASLVDYREAHARETVVRRDLSDAAELVQLARVRAAAGIVPTFDAVRAEALMRDAEARLTVFAGTRAGALGRLIALTGRDGSFVQAALSEKSETALPPEMAAGLPSDLLRNRPDVRAAAARLAASRDAVASAAAQRLPRITLTGALGLLAFANGGVFAANALQASLGSGLTAPLLDFGRIGAQIDTRNAQAREAFETYRGAVFRAIGETEGALGSYRAARSRLSALDAQSRLDADALGLARERYRLGLADFLTVLDAQRTLNGTRQNEETARSDLRRSAITLYRSFGAPEAPKSPI